MGIWNMDGDTWFPFQAAMRDMARAGTGRYTLLVDDAPSGILGDPKATSRRHAVYIAHTRCCFNP